MSTSTLDRTVARPRGAHVVLAGASLGAGVIHAAVVPEHLEEAWTFGAFFAALAAFQVGWAVWLLVRPSSTAYVAGAVANGGVIAIWLASRTMGLPVGPEPWTAEHIGIADAAATLAEIVLVGGCLALVRPVVDRTARAASSE